MPAGITVSSTALGHRRGSRSGATVSTQQGMSETDPAEPTPDPAATLESEMEAELDALRAKGPAPGTEVRNPVFRHEQRVGTATDATDATELAARVSGQLAAEADQERVKIEAEVTRIEQAEPGSTQAADAEAARALAERDADEAIADSLDADVAADDVRSSEGTGVFHRGADPERALADKQRALADESTVGRDLADLDSLETRVERDSERVGPPLVADRTGG